MEVNDYFAIIQFSNNKDISKIVIDNIGIKFRVDRNTNHLNKSGAWKLYRSTFDTRDKELRFRSLLREIGKEKEKEKNNNDTKERDRRTGTAERDEDLDEQKKKKEVPRSESVA
ncbi:hypothetical protein F2P81_015306 [Scophthalmus maximus]|uniref:Uncharacterized protein n=1 Tax=Scophthalmus maximus TaxID=52904 RepID=A0A6A4SCZ3_SCOMX|nr:hypothetical protein F2P81_015306 [Scophthalmus maximus]